MCSLFGKGVLEIFKGSRAKFSLEHKIVPTFSNELRFNMEGAIFHLDDIQLNFKSITFPRSVRFDFNCGKFGLKSVRFAFKSGQFDLNISSLI